MTAVTTERMRLRTRESQIKPPSWEKVGVIVAVLAHLGAAVWFASGLDHRVAALEKELPPGGFLMLDKRTEHIEKVVDGWETRR